MSEFDVDRSHYSHSEALAEALLFAAGTSVTLEDIAVVLKLKYKEAEAVLEKLSEKYASLGSGLVIKKFNGSYQLASRPALHDELKPHFEQISSAPLSRSALEALTIIAYNQPITRGNVEIIRGVNSDSVISTLLDRGLICEVGRSESPGRPVLYGTSTLFLKSSGLESIEELKAVSPEPTLLDLETQGENETDVAREDFAFGFSLTDETVPDKSNE